MATFPRLRSSEWLLVAYFVYVALIAPFFSDRPHLKYQPLVTLLAIFLLLCLLAILERQPLFQPTISYVRDWLPMFLALSAFREMEYFLPTSYGYSYEAAWVRQDQVFLGSWHIRRAIESLGSVIPFYLELCYLLVYGLPAYCVTILYFRLKRELVDRFIFMYLLGTLLAYSLFPYFPSQPPRLVFPGIEKPNVATWVRELNLYILDQGTIHTAVFPSAHVSSAFAAAWALLILLPERKTIGLASLLYAMSVSLATIYGRYHYLADVISGFGISLIAGFVCLIIRFRYRDLGESTP